MKFLTARSVFALNKRCKLLDSKDRIKLLFKITSRALIEEPLQSWEEEVENLRVNQMSTKASCKKCWKELLKEIYRESTCKNQLEHMECIYKPKDLSMSEYIKKIVSINHAL